MKQAIAFLILITTSLSAFGQVKMVITDIGVANNAQDTSRYADMQNISLYYGPRFLIRADIVNSGPSSLHLYGDSDGRFDLHYSLQGKEKMIKGRSIAKFGFDDDYYVVYPCSTFKLVVVVYDEDFPEENYCSAFYKVIPSMRLVYTRDQPYWGLPVRLESEKIDMNKVRIKCDLER